MSFIKNNKGNTLVEVVVVAGIMLLISINCMSMLVFSMRSLDGTTMQVYSDMDAVRAMQRIVIDIREAKSFVFLASGKQLQLTYPTVLPQGYYNRKEADPTNLVTYYLSDATGNINSTGTILWRSTYSGSKSKIANNISSILFETDTTRSIQVTINAANQASAGSKTTQLIERVVYLRNN